MSELKTEQKTKSSTMVKAKIKAKPKKTKRQVASKLEPITVYFAGALFNVKELLGNMLIGAAIDRLSQGRYKCILPQNLEIGDMRSSNIRNVDLLNVMLADMCVFNFDGTELDSGTVVEFMFAKSLDIPCAAVRTDFRSAGDQKEGDPWNLMCSFWPRYERVFRNAMVAYHDHVHKPEMNDGITAYCDHIAAMIIEALDKAARHAPVYSAVDAKAAYRLARLCAGGGFADLITPQKMSKLIEGKQRKGLLLK